MRFSDQFDLDLRVDDASWVCREAVLETGWKIASAEPNRIEVKVGAALFAWPSTIEILLNESGPSATTIQLNGKTIAYGPIQKAHLTGSMNQLRNAIEVQARRETRSAAAAQRAES